MTNKEIFGLHSDIDAQQTPIACGAYVVDQSVPADARLAELGKQWQARAEAREREFQQMVEAGSDPRGLEEFRRVMRRAGR